MLLCEFSSNNGKYMYVILLYLSDHTVGINWK